MSEASGRAEMQRRLIEKSLQDESFRRRLMEDPKGAVEETAETIYLVLPSTSIAGGEGVALSSQQLESVAGGGVFDNYTGHVDTCNDSMKCFEVIHNG